MAVATAPRGARKTAPAVPVAGKTLADFPDIAAQLHPELNGGITADQIAAGSNEKRTWVCDQGPDHLWSAAVCSRTALGAGCPCCAGQKLSVTNSLASLFPDIAAQFRPELNGGRTAGEILAGAGEKCAWVCDLGPDHVWSAAVCTRTRGHGCPFCFGKRPSVTNSLASLQPKLATQLHPTLNGDLTADQIVAGSAKTVWWKCDAGPDHEWSVSVRDRTRGHSCPFCAGKRASVTNSLGALFPKVAAQLHPTLNGRLTADEILAGSHKKCTWVCDLGPDHVWSATVRSRTSGYGCPHCSVSGRSRFELRVAELVSQHTGLHVDVDVKITIPGRARRVQVDLEISELGFLIDLDPAYWHQNAPRDQRKLDLLAMRDDRIYVRVRETGAPPLRGNVVEAKYCPEAFAESLRPFLEALGHWRELDSSQVATALADADAEWSELLSLTNEQFAKAA